MASKLYCATLDPESGVVSWGEWQLAGDGEVLALDTLDVPGRGPVLGLIVKRPSGVYIETVALTEGSL